MRLTEESSDSLLSSWPMLPSSDMVLSSASSATIGTRIRVALVRNDLSRSQVLSSTDLTVGTW